MLSEGQIATTLDEEAAAKASARMSVAYKPPEITKIGGKGNVRLVTATQSKMCLVRNLADVICIDPTRSQDSSCNVPGLPPQLVRTTAGVYTHSSTPLGAAPTARDSLQARSDAEAAAERPRLDHEGAADAGPVQGGPRTAAGGGVAPTAVQPTSAAQRTSKTNGRTGEVADAANEQRDGSQRTCSVCAQARPLSDFMVAMATCTSCRRLRKRAREVQMGVAELSQRVRSGSIEAALQERELTGPREPASAAANKFFWACEYQDWQQGRAWDTGRGPQAPPEWDGAWLRGGAGRFVIGPSHELSEIVQPAASSQASPPGTVAPVNLPDTVNGSTCVAPPAAPGTAFRAATRRKSVPGRLPRAPATDSATSGKDSASEALEGGREGSHKAGAPRKTSCTICHMPNTGARCKQCNVYAARAYTHGVGLDVLRVAVHEGWAQDLLPLRKHGKKARPAPPDHAICPNCDQCKPTSAFVETGQPPRTVLCCDCAEAHDVAKRRAAGIAARLQLNPIAPRTTRATTGAGTGTRSAGKPADVPVDPASPLQLGAKTAPAALQRQPGAAQPTCDMCPNMLTPDDKVGRCDHCTMMFGAKASSAAPQQQPEASPARPEAVPAGGACTVVTIDSDSDDGAAAPQNHAAGQQGGACEADATADAPQGTAPPMLPGGGALGGAGVAVDEALFAKLMQQLIRAIQSDHSQQQSGVVPSQHASAEQVIQQLGMQLDRNAASLNLPSIMGLSGGRDAAKLPAPAAPLHQPMHAEELFRALQPPCPAAAGLHSGYGGASLPFRDAVNLQMLEQVLGQALPLAGVRPFSADAQQRQARGSDHLSFGFPPDAGFNGRGGGWEQRGLPVEHGWGRPPPEANVTLDGRLKGYPPAQAAAASSSVPKAIGHMTFVPARTGEEPSHLPLADREARRRGTDDAPRADSPGQQPAVPDLVSRPNGGAALSHTTEPAHASLMRPGLSGGTGNLEVVAEAPFAAAPGQSLGAATTPAVQRSAVDQIDGRFVGQPVAGDPLLWGARHGSNSASAGAASARAAASPLLHRSDSASDAGRVWGSSELGHVGLAQIYNDIAAPPPMRQLDFHSARAPLDVGDLLRGALRRPEPAHASLQEILADAGAVVPRGGPWHGLAGAADHWPAR